MTDKEALLAKTVDTLVDQAAEVLDLAKGQRAAADKQQTAANVQQEAADRQHVNAHKLEAVGAALKVDVAALKDKLNEVATAKLPHPPASTANPDIRH